MKKILLLSALLVATSATAMTAGHYEQHLGDGSSDILNINQDGSMSLELTRQVGGPGGISNDGVVPYPTVCRVKQFGTIISEDVNFIAYQVKFVRVANLVGLTNTENCVEYVGEFNGRAMTSTLSFSMTKAQYTQSK